MRIKELIYDPQWALPEGSKDQKLPKKDSFEEDRSAHKCNNNIAQSWSTVSTDGYSFLAEWTNRSADDSVY